MSNISAAAKKSTTGASSDDPQNTDKNFPSRLFRFLNVVDTYGISHIACWQPHGRCFRIHKPKEFENLTEPSWFVYKKYSSFQRQLNIYGFVRIIDGIDKNCYYHKHFLRGHEHLLHKIIRIPTKKDTPTSTITNTAISVLNSSSIQNHSVDVNPLVSLSNVAAGVDSIQRINRSNENQVIQSTTAGPANVSHRDLLSNNSHTITLPTKIELLLLMEQNSASIRNASDVSLTISQNRVGVTGLSLERQAFLLQLEREQLNRSTNLALPNSAQSNQIAIQQSQSAIFQNLVSHPPVVQNEQGNPTSHIMVELHPQLLHSDPISIRHLSSEANLNERNQLLQGLWYRRNRELLQHILCTDVSLLPMEVRGLINQVVDFSDGYRMGGNSDVSNVRDGS